jgi:hypothetical protein
MKSWPARIALALYIGIGFTIAAMRTGELAEIKQLIDLHRVLASMGPKPFLERPNELQGIIEIGHERLAAIKQKSQTLNAMRRQLEWLLKQLETASVVICPAQSGKRPHALKKSP